MDEDETAAFRRSNMPSNENAAQPGRMHYMSLSKRNLLSKRLSGKFSSASKLFRTSSDDDVSKASPSVKDAFGLFDKDGDVRVIQRSQTARTMPRAQRSHVKRLSCWPKKHVSRAGRAK